MLAASIRLLNHPLFLAVSFNNSSGSKTNPVEDELKLNPPKDELFSVRLNKDSMLFDGNSMEEKYAVAIIHTVVVVFFSSTQLLSI